jgi:hypothetical protein
MRAERDERSDEEDRHRARDAGGKQQAADDRERDDDGGERAPGDRCVHSGLVIMRRSVTKPA